MSLTVFIDGAAGTTGLEIAERLAGRPEFSLIQLDDAKRKDAAARRDALHAADFAVLCLHDDAAREAVAMAEGAPKSLGVRIPGVRIIDASTAHRVAPGWTYGFAEIIGREAIVNAARVSNPGCYPTGFLALMVPLLRAGLLPADWPYTVNAVSGYSGGGRAMIAAFEGDPAIAFSAYSLSLGHKHLPEMQIYAGLAHPPVFSPAVIAAYRGMVVDVPLPLSAMRASTGKALDPAHIGRALADFYDGSPVVAYEADGEPELVLRRDAAASDRLVVRARFDPDGEQGRLIATLDNLGKGAAGAAVQNLNLMAGLPETAGLRL